MKILSLIALLSVSFFISTSSENHISSYKKSLVNEKCEFEGIQLYGKIKLVEHQHNADIKVKIVNSFPDLRVKFVENFADDCGEWEIVENGEDVKVYITENFPDIKIQPVTSFPGLD